MNKTVVVLEVYDEDESREWWRALGLPDPSRWNPTNPDRLSPFPPNRNVYVTPVLERKTT